MAKKYGSKPKYQYGLSVVGVTRMWVNERTVKSRKTNKDVSWTEYTTSIGRKEEDGSYTNIYIPIFFAKELEKPDNDCLIGISEGNLFVTGNKDYEKLSLYVREYEELEE